MPLCLPPLSGVFAGVDPFPRRSRPRAQFRPLDRYLNDHLLVRLRGEITRDRSSKDSPGTIVWILRPADPCSFLHANDCELTLAIVTLLRTPTTLRPRDSRDALKSIDCHSLRHEL